MHRPFAEPHSWFGPPLPDYGANRTDNPHELERLWRGFMTARVVLGLLLSILQGIIFLLSSTHDSTLSLMCVGYFMVALVVRLKSSSHQRRNTLDFQWISTIGVDIVAFGILQATQGSHINYAPLFALPVLMASVLGSLLLAMGTAAAVTLMLFTYAAWLSVFNQLNATAYFLQAALAGAGYFVISFLANQVAIRLANVEFLAQHNQLAVRVQQQVNELVIESLPDGILVVDQRGAVLAANPAARRLLGADQAPITTTIDLVSVAGWQGLVHLMRLSFSKNQHQDGDVVIHHPGEGPRRIRVHIQLTARLESHTESLCVMFLQDQREMEARIRTEKLASMGRMSAAVAHEIRNPLAAISQANELLGEDLLEPRHQQLTQMIQQNAKRLGKIVDEVLNISRVQHRANTRSSVVMNLTDALHRICRDWQSQTGRVHRVHTDLSTENMEIHFDPEHLRRILINLLDNAHRYATQEDGAIQVSSHTLATGQCVMRVWSNGLPMDQSVERHLFEPFFSSESRSSGLGLYICRELCEEQGALISYHRSARHFQKGDRDGNEFTVMFGQHNTHTTGEDTSVTPWLQTSL
jgi:two-component system, NtrC family, sensor histidine kinase PilS